VVLITGIFYYSKGFAVWRQPPPDAFGRINNEFEMTLYEYGSLVKYPDIEPIPAMEPIEVSGPS
jgi:hypothetical protein